MGLREPDQQPECDDALIVERVLAGEVAEFERFVERYERALVRVAYSQLSDMSLAEEAVQEAFLAAFKSLKTFNPEFAFRTWLWTILLNQCRRLGARQRKQQVLLSSGGGQDAALSEVEGRESSPEVQAADVELADRVSAWIDRLPANEAEAIRLRFFGRLKFREVAEVQGCSLATAKNRVRRGLEALSDLLPDSAES